MLQLLNLFRLLPSLKNLLHVSVFFILQIVDTIFYFLLIKPGLFQRKLSSLCSRLEIMLDEALSVTLRTRLRFVRFVRL